MYAWEFARALAISDREGFARFATMQNHYNLIYREEEREMMPLCEFEGVAVIPWSPLARGLLAGTRQKLGDDSTARSATDGLDKFLYDQPSDWDVVEAVRAVAKQRGVAPAQVALAWLCSRPAVVAPILGATKPGHLEDGLSALELELEAEEIAALEAPYRPHPVKGIAPQSSMRRR
jgi:aryl-alcohol dehydrogenase-like predicted oxidoreductase